MTEQQWLADLDLWSLLDFVQETASDRKVRLFAVACCRRKWESITDERCRRVVEAAECFADDPQKFEDMERAVTKVRGSAGEWRWTDEGGPEVPLQADLVLRTAHFGRVSVSAISGRCYEFSSLDSAPAAAAESRAQIDLVRDLIGNPFAPPVVDPAWLTSTVLALARSIYDGKTFDRLPVLADALADAGCENDDLLSHCRGDGPHVRGCWALDLLLGHPWERPADPFKPSACDRCSRSSACRATVETVAETSWVPSEGWRSPALVELQHQRREMIRFKIIPFAIFVMILIDTVLAYLLPQIMLGRAARRSGELFPARSPEGMTKLDSRFRDELLPESLFAFAFLVLIQSIAFVMIARWWKVRSARQRPVAI